MPNDEIVSFLKIHLQSIQVNDDAGEPDTLVASTCKTSTQP